MVQRVLTARGWGPGLYLALALGCGRAPPLAQGELPLPGAFTLVVMPDTQGYAANPEWDQALGAPPGRT